MGSRSDETWHRLRVWTSGQAPSERLALQLLLSDGYSRVDPSHPLGGPDGGRDAIVHRNDARWIMAAYFPRQQQSFSAIKSKFVADFQGVDRNEAHGMAFVTNQELTLAERAELTMASVGRADIYHLERIVALLDQPSMHSVRSQYLGIGADPALPPIRYRPAYVQLLSTGAAPVDLVGRGREQAAIWDFLAGTAASSDVCVVSGMPGVGKTAVALAACSGALAQFTGGAIRVDLDSYREDPWRDPAGDHHFTSALLEAIGESPTTIDDAQLLVVWQAFLSARSAASERVLLLFDNVSDYSQVSRLVPRGLGHRTIVTSRTKMAPTISGSTAIGVEPLDRLESSVLLTTSSGRVSTAAGDASTRQEPAALLRIADLCAGLPLALNIAAAILASDPGLTAAELADELGETATRLSSLEYADVAVRAAFVGSLERLDEESAATFALMSVHPGRDWSQRSAASILGASESDAGRRLRRLRQASLIERGPAPSRWLMHDLLYVFAREQLSRHADELDADASRRRLTEQYRSDLEDATWWINAATDLSPDSPFPGRAPAVAWLAAEVGNALACARAAFDGQDYEEAWSIGITAGEYLHVSNRLQEGLEAAELALRAASALNDRSKEAGALNNVGLVHNTVGNLDLAKVAFMKGAKAYREIGEVGGEARVLIGLAEAIRKESGPVSTIGTLRRAVRLYQVDEDVRGVGFALTNLGISLREAGRFLAAQEVLRHALKIHEATGARHAEAATLSQLGTCLGQAGRLPEGEAMLRRAIDVYSEVGNHGGVAMATMNLGNQLRMRGDLQGSGRLYERALAIFVEVNDHGGADLARKNLATLRRTGA